MESRSSPSRRPPSLTAPHSILLKNDGKTTTPKQVVDDAFEGELHVTIVATGFPPSFEDALLADGAASATRSGGGKRASSASAAAPEAAAGKGGRTIQAPRSWQVWG